MSLFLYRPTGRELRPKLVSITEIVLVLALIVGASIATGFWTAREFNPPPEQAGASGAISILLTMLVYLLIRSRIVRRGWVHPIGLMADEKNHAGCRCGR